MTTGKSFFDYRHFVRRYAQFEKVFYLSQSLLPRDYSVSALCRENLRKLNKNRIDIYKKAGESNSSISAVCEKCNGKCCQGPYDHFTAIDFWLRKYSSNPLVWCPINKMN